MVETGLIGRTALVTGGSRGIGRAICIALAREGVKVAVNFLSDSKAADETVRLVGGAGGTARAYQADVADEAAVRAAVAQVEADLGPVELLVANAGSAVPEEPLAMSLANWRHMMRINGDGVFIPITTVAPKMVERGYGRIVCLASIAALRPRPQMAAYSAAKAAVIAFARSCSEAYAPDVRINCIAPGLIETELAGTVDRDALIRATPAGRIGRPEEIADAAVYLLSDRSSYTTGQTLVVSGGRVNLP
jgi:3-oxoacyl-[acyl-carrier protein] reductase